MAHNLLDDIALLSKGGVAQELHLQPHLFSVLFYLPEILNIEVNSARTYKMNGFRKKFVFPDLSVANWFPGHMAKGLCNQEQR